MAGNVKRRTKEERGEPAYIVEIESEPADDAEERLLRAYEFLLADSTLPERKERA